jgi:hypothetical protein
VRSNRAAYPSGGVGRRRRAGRASRRAYTAAGPYRVAPDAETGDSGNTQTRIAATAPCSAREKVTASAPSARAPPVPPTLRSAARQQSAGPSFASGVKRNDNSRHAIAFSRRSHVEDVNSKDSVMDFEPFSQVSEGKWSLHMRA